MAPVLSEGLRVVRTRKASDRRGIGRHADAVSGPVAGRKFPLEQANEAVAASKEVGRASEGKFFLEG